MVRIGRSSTRGTVHLVTQARRPMSEDISNRQRRYLVMMGFRAVCFGITVLMVLYHFGWWAAIPAVFAIFVPYIAVVYANGGREPDNVRGFLEYRPNLPERYAVGRHGGAEYGGPGATGEHAAVFQGTVDAGAADSREEAEHADHASRIVDDRDRDDQNAARHHTVPPQSANPDT